MAKPKTRGRRVLPVSVRVAALALVALNCSCDLCDFLLILAGSDPSDPPVDCHHLEWVAVESLTFPPVHRSMTRLLPAGVAAADRFGAAIAIDGDTIVVGAPGYDSHLRPSYAGAAYVFTKSSDSTWTQTAALTASDPHIGSLFGAAVAVSPDLIAVGAPGTDAGAVYVFRRSGGTWTEVDRLSGAGPADRFGAAVALDGSRLAVGAPLHIPSGEVYVYTEEQPDTWTSRDQLYGPELGHVAGDYFGASLDLRGDWLAAGAPGYPGSNLTAGACHVFHREADGFWYLSTDLTSMIERRPTTNADQFGAAVAVLPNLLLGGVVATAPNRTHPGGTGVMFCATHSQFSQCADPPPVTGFGRAVCASDRLVATSSIAGTTGKVWLYDRLAPTSLQILGDGTLEAPDATTGDEFGAALDIAGSNVAIGAPGKDDDGGNSGAAYVATVTIGYVPKRGSKPPAGWNDARIEFTRLGDAAGAGGGIIRVPRELAGAFRWRITAGAFGGAPPSGWQSASFGPRIVVAGTDPEQFLGISAKFVVGGIEAVAATEAGPSGTPVRFFGATTLEFSVAHEAGEIVLGARIPGGAAFTGLARLAAPQGALWPSISTSAVPPGGAIGFDDWSLTYDVEPPLPDDPAPRAVELVQRSVSLQLSGMGALERAGSGPAPDVAASVPLLKEARKALATARRTAWVGPGAGPAKASKRLRSALRSVSQALKKLKPDRPLDAVTSRIQTAMESELTALADLRQ